MDRSDAFWTKALAKFGAYFEERGLNAGDIPVAIIVHEILGVGMAILAWTLCYHIQPGKTVARPLITSLERSRHHSKLQAAYSKAMNSATNTVKKLSWLSKKNVDKNADTSLRLTTSLAESLILRATAKPATFVFKLWASYNLVAFGKTAFAFDKKKLLSTNS